MESSASLPSASFPGCSIWAVVLYFQTKVEQVIRIEDIPDAVARGGFVWIDVTVDDPAAARDTLRAMKLVDAHILDSALHGAEATMQARYEDCLHLVMSGCKLTGRDFSLQRIDAVIGRTTLVTIHRGPVLVVDAMRREFSADFQRYAQTPSFLLYELWDHLVENYQEVQNRFEDLVEGVQRELIQSMNEAVFLHVSELGTDLLHFRKILLPARAVLTELATRKSVFISEATQPYLLNMVGAVERVLQDLIVDHEVLNNSLNLHMSMVSHRTNLIMQRLTVFSVIFMPLTFLCGIYGMNFEFLPEVKWEFGYVMFWIVAATIVVLQLTWLSRKRWL